MASSRSIAFAFLVLVAAATVADSAITCGQVNNYMFACVSYLTGHATAPPANCCGNVRALNNAAKTTPDRQQVCNCLKAAAAQIKVNAQAASGLPAKCGVKIPYAISTSTNCAKVFCGRT